MTGLGRGTHRHESARDDEERVVRHEKDERVRVRRLRVQKLLKEGLGVGVWRVWGFEGLGF